MDIQEILTGGETVLLDGGMGTELQWAVVPMHETVWSATALESNPDTVRRVHADYIRAGAQVITTNTFSSARHSLAKAGLADKTVAWHRRAVGLAREARDEVATEHPVLVAGSISRFGSWGGVTERELRDSLSEQAELMASAGVDHVRGLAAGLPGHPPST